MISSVLSILAPQDRFQSIYDEIFNIHKILNQYSLSSNPFYLTITIQSNKQLVKYTNNEAYFDVIEEVDAIIDKQGATVSAEIHGYIGELFYLSIYLSIIH